MYPLMYTKQKRGDNRQLVAVNSATGKVNLRRLSLSSPNKWKDDHVHTKISSNRSLCVPNQSRHW